MTSNGGGSGGGGRGPIHDDTNGTTGGPEAGMRAIAAMLEAPDAVSGDPIALGSDAEWPWGFVMTNDGLCFAPPPAPDGTPPAPLWICSPIAMLGLCRTEESGQWGKVLVFADPDGTEKTHVVSAGDLAGGDGSVIRQVMAAAGLLISGKKAAKDKLIEALAGVRSPNRVCLRAAVGWGVDGSFYAMPAETFGTGGPVVLEGQAKGAHFAQAGTLENWREWVRELAASHDLLVFFIALGFSGPLLDVLGLDGGGFHLVGKSSTGKSTALAVAASVWGGSNFMQSWRATANALEGVAAAHNDALLCLDEIGICNPSDVGIAAYVLSGGAGKQRMRSDGDLKALRRWRIVIASTGELSLADKVGEDGRHRAMAGQEIRLIDLRIAPESTSGVFDGDGTPEHFDALARRLKARAATSYGTAGPAFVHALVANRQLCATNARSFMAEFAAEHVPQGADGQVSRVASRFALVAAAGELAILMKILPFEPGHVSAAAGRRFANWIDARGGVGSSEDRQAVARIRDFINTHGSSRFQLLRRADDADPSYGPHDESWRAQYAAGYRSSEFWYFHDASWREALGGLDADAAADALHRHGFLHRDSTHRKVKVATPKSRQRLYAVRNAILAGE